MLTMQNGEPILNVWFGNFYKPAYDDFNYIDETMKLIHQLGFNCVELDSKAWEDFADRFHGGEASEYILAQEYMMQSAKRHNLQHCFLALYLNGDNLYPNIRFSPPIYGESVINENGEDGKWYKYWSKKAQDSMIEHVQGLQQLYADNQAEIISDGVKKIPLCSMWDPIVAPSFDDEGQKRYLDWLHEEYGSIDLLNTAYETSFSSFSSLSKEDYWFTCKYGKHAIYTPEQRDALSPAFRLWCDNMKWKRRELRLYFAAMQQRFAQLPQNLYLSPDLAQWSYFLNVDGSRLSGVGMADLWDTAVRGIDIYELAPYVDNCHFLTVPVTPAGDANAYVVACQHSMMRCMNRGRDFLGGVFLGRFLYNDVYETVTPAEIIGSVVAAGAKGYFSYGINGLDDGGLLDRMPNNYLTSLKIANQWAKEVIPLLSAPLQSEIALLFPSAMACFEPLAIKNGDMHRLDMLGWYTACCDLGYAPDVIDYSMAANGSLAQYRVLIIPCNTCYLMEPNHKAEMALREFAENGGVILHGPNDFFVKNALGICPLPHTSDAFFYTENVLPSGDAFCTYKEGEMLANYLSDDGGCIVRNETVYSFGFLYGTSYISKNAPHVPLAQKNNALYPVQLMRTNILEDILRQHIHSPANIHCKGLESAVFQTGSILINHTAYPISLPQNISHAIFQYPSTDHTLLPHSAVYIFNNSDITAHGKVTKELS